MENLEPIACFHDTIDHFETNRCRSDSPGFVLELKESLRQSAYDFRALGNLKLPKQAALGKSCIPLSLSALFIISGPSHWSFLETQALTVHQFSWCSTAPPKKPSRLPQANSFIPFPPRNSI
jgi:hypothetical protein